MLSHALFQVLFQFGLECTTDIHVKACVCAGVSPSSLWSSRVTLKPTTRPRPGSTAWQTPPPCSVVSTEQYPSFTCVRFQNTESFCVCVAPFGSLIANRWSCRVSVMLGGLLSSCGLLLSSFSNSLEFLYFSMGIMMGQRKSSCVTLTLNIHIIPSVMSTDINISMLI